MAASSGQCLLKMEMRLRQRIIPTTSVVALRLPFVLYIAGNDETCAVSRSVTTRFVLAARNISSNLDTPPSQPRVQPYRAAST